jgi:hypothetical protein
MNMKVAPNNLFHLLVKFRIFWRPPSRISVGRPASACAPPVGSSLRSPTVRVLLGCANHSHTFARRMPVAVSLPRPHRQRRFRTSLRSDQRPLPGSRRAQPTYASPSLPPPSLIGPGATSVAGATHRTCRPDGGSPERCRTFTTLPPDPFLVSHPIGTFSCLSVCCGPPLTPSWSCNTSSELFSTTPSVPAVTPAQSHR